MWFEIEHYEKLKSELPDREELEAMNEDSDFAAEMCYAIWSVTGSELNEHGYVTKYNPEAKKIVIDTILKLKELARDKWEDK